MVRDAGRPPEEHALHQTDQETGGPYFLNFCLTDKFHSGKIDSRKSNLFLFFQAIYELYRGEQDLIEDLQLARKVQTHENLNESQITPPAFVLMLEPFCSGIP